LSRCFVLQQDMNASATVTPSLAYASARKGTARKPPEPKKCTTVPVRALVIRTMSIPDVVEWSASDKSLRKQGPYSKDVWGRVRVRAESVGGRPVFAERRSRWTSTKCAGPACSDACSARRSRRPREIDPRSWGSSISKLSDAALGAPASGEAARRCCLRSCASWGEEDMGEGRRAVAQLAEDRRADEAPKPVSGDFAEEIAQPPAIKPKVHEPCGDIDEV
jgi:hypothetical protein